MNKHKYEVVTEVGDKSENDAFRRLLNDCREGKIDFIIVKNVQRYSKAVASILEYVKVSEG